MGKKEFEILSIDWIRQNKFFKIRKKEMKNSKSKIKRKKAEVQI